MTPTSAKTVSHVKSPRSPPIHRYRCLHFATSPCEMRDFRGIAVRDFREMGVAMPLCDIAVRTSATRRARLFARWVWAETHSVRFERRSRE